MTNAERLEFTLQAYQGEEVKVSCCKAGKSGQKRDYQFRVESSAEFAYWVRGLKKHIEHQRKIETVKM